MLVVLVRRLGVMAIQRYYVVGDLVFISVGKQLLKLQLSPQFGNIFGRCFFELAATCCQLLLNIWVTYKRCGQHIPGLSHRSASTAHWVYVDVNSVLFPLLSHHVSVIQTVRHNSNTPILHRQCKKWQMQQRVLRCPFLPKAYMKCPVYLFPYRTNQSPELI